MVSIAEFLQSCDRLDIADQNSLNGFNGVHGGLAVAMLVRQMRMLVSPDRPLVVVTAHFIRPLVWPMVVDAGVMRDAANVTTACASASSEGGTCLEATAVFGAQKVRDTPRLAPPMPTGLTNRVDATPLVMRTELVPIFERLEIRPATTGSAYGGGADPLLCCWVRLRDDVAANEERITILLDSLAPSYTAVLTKPTAVPTVQMSVQLAAGAAEAAFDWVLVRAATTSADEHGFVREAIDMWTEGGLYLATCTQQRIVR